MDKGIHDGRNDQLRPAYAPFLVIAGKHRVPGRGREDGNRKTAGALGVKMPEPHQRARQPGQGLEPSEFDQQLGQNHTQGEERNNREQKPADSLLSLKGVKHGKLVLTIAGSGPNVRRPHKHE